MHSQTKRRYDKNQATSLANACGNDKLPMYVFCQNIDSQVQGDKNAVAIDGVQQSGDDRKDKKDPTHRYRHPIMIWQSWETRGGNGLII